MNGAVARLFPHLVVVGKCIYCGGDVYDYGGEPFQLYHPTDRLKQVLRKGFVHKDCFDRAFKKFNKDMNSEGQLKNYKLWKKYKGDEKNGER